MGFGRVPENAVKVPALLAVPVGVGEGSLRVAMSDPFDLRTLDAIERITGLKPVPYLAMEEEFEKFLEGLTLETGDEAAVDSARHS